MVVSKVYGKKRSSLKRGVSVITRAYDAEAPYIQGFIDHYQGIGVRDIHIVVPRGNPSDYLLCAIEGYSGVTVHHQGWEGGGIDDAQNLAVASVDTEHILFVDVDEFLDASDTAPIESSAYVEFSWTLAPFPMAYPHSAGTPGIKDHQVKYSVRTSEVSRLNIHDCNCISSLDRERSKIGLIHYTSRSFKDLIIRHGFGGYRGTYLEMDVGVLENPPERLVDLPQKFKLAAIYKRLSLTTGVRAPIFCSINYELEDEIFGKVIGADVADEFRFAFDEYAGRLDLCCFKKKVRRDFCFRKYGRLPHHALPSIADQCLIGEEAPEKWRPPEHLKIIDNIKALSRSVCKYLGARVIWRKK